MNVLVLFGTMSLLVLVLLLLLGLVWSCPKGGSLLKFLFSLRLMSSGGLLWSLSQGYSAHLASMDKSGSSKVSSVQDVWDVYRRVFVLADLV